MLYEVITPVLILTAVVFSLSFYKAYTLKQDSADGRLFIWKVCAQAIQEKPLLAYRNNFV